VCQSGLAPSLAAVDVVIAPRLGDNHPAPMRGVLGTLTCRAHASTAVSVAKARLSPQVRELYPGQSTFPMRCTKHLSFQCPETPSAGRDRASTW
jgi:hypothetical protein